jgi:hypothetical protein
MGEEKRLKESEFSSFTKEQSWGFLVLLFSVPFHLYSPGIFVSTLVVVFFSRSFFLSIIGGW